MCVCVYAVEICISVTRSSRVSTRWGYCGKLFSGGWCWIWGISYDELSLFCLPRKIDIETLKTDQLMPLVWSCRRETHMVHGNTIWVWSMQIWPPKGLMLQTRLLSSDIALPFLYSEEFKESLREFSPIHGILVRTMCFVCTTLLS